jgi:hypothetical protein
MFVNAVASTDAIQTISERFYNLTKIFESYIPRSCKKLVVNFSNIHIRGLVIDLSWIFDFRSINGSGLTIDTHDNSAKSSEFKILLTPGRLRPEGHDVGKK